MLSPSTNPAVPSSPQPSVGRSYTVYAEPLDGAVAPAQISPSIVTLCRNPTSDPGWPPLQDASSPQ